MRKIKRLFIDLETSPYLAYVWRTGKQFVNHDLLHNTPKCGAIICACWKFEGGKMNHFEWNKGNDKQLVKNLIPVLHEADEIIAQNGDRFDIPYINTRIMLHGLGPQPVWKTVDTLVIARRRFKFPSNRLDALGKFMFGEGKIRVDFQLWRDIIEDNCEKAMSKMVKYCKKDVVLLERVWAEMQMFHGNKTHAGVLNGWDKTSCPHCSCTETAKRKEKITAAGTPQVQLQCKKCGKYFTVSESTYLRSKE